MLVVIAYSFFILHFVVVLHLLMFFIHICFSTSSLTLLWTIAGFLHPFHTFSPAHRRVICDTFMFNHFVIFLPGALQFWVGIFYPQALFILGFFTDILPAFIKASVGSGSSSLKFAGLHTDPQNTHFILSSQPIAEWFVTRSCSTIPLSSYRERYSFEWAFFTHKRYLS